MKYLVLLIVLVVFTGCDLVSGSTYRKTLRDGIKTVPHVQEILAIFPPEDVDHIIGHVPSRNRWYWTSQVFFAGRYEFTYQVEIVADYDKKLVTVVGEPSFSILEIVSIDKTGLQTVGDVFKFGSAEWKKIVEAKGDFSAAGITLKTNAPVPGLAEQIEYMRQSRVRGLP
jgi:hypothetical protein